MIRAAAAVAAAAALAACETGAATRSGPVVYAASSVAAVAARIEPRARVASAGSDELAHQITAGAPADVFASASPRYTRALRTSGLVGRPRVFATNRLVLVIRRDNPAGIDSVADLAAPGVDVVIGEPGAPVGDYARAALRSLGAEDVLGSVASEEPDAASVAAKVALGEADAGFVYATDAAGFAGDVVVVELPGRAQPRIEYTVAVVTSAPDPAGARRFVGLLLGERGRRALAAAGFGLP